LAPDRHRKVAGRCDGRCTGALIAAAMAPAAALSSLLKTLAQMRVTTVAPQPRLGPIVTDSDPGGGRRRGVGMAARMEAQLRQLQADAGRCARL